MKRTDWIALLLCLMAAAAAARVGRAVYENMAHIEDEFAYIWQAQVMARGDLTRPSPDHAKSFLVPFVVDHDGRRFGKYPLGWPAALSLGVRAGARSWVNPLLAGWSAWLLYRLGSLFLNKKLSLVAVFLMISSPFFLMNAGSLLSHVWSLFLTLAFLLSWMDGFRDHEQNSNRHPWVKAVAAGGSLGLLGLTRPLTMAAVAFPFAVQGVFFLMHGSSSKRKRVLTVGTITLALMGLHLVWQYAAAGSFFKNPYTLWWSYDRYGFGPGKGVTGAGHSLYWAWKNTRYSLRVGMWDLFGWVSFSWIFLLPGLAAGFRIKKTEYWLLSAVPVVLVLLYGGYWVGSWLIGPRYYFEAFPAFCVLSAAGIALAAGWSLSPGEDWKPFAGWKKIRPLGVAFLVALMIAANLAFYLPVRLGGMKGLYTIERTDLALFTTPEAQTLTPALVIVHSQRWMSYGSLLELTSPYFDTPFLFAWSRGPRADAALAADFRGEYAIYHYYPDDEPRRLYSGPRPK